MKLTLPPFRILDQDVCRRIHQEALKVLKIQGFRVHSAQMRKKLAAAGARVDDSDIVTLPEQLVAQAVAAAPSEFSIYDLDGNAIQVKEGNASETIASYVEAIQWLDYEAQTLRPSTLCDLKKALALADALPGVGFTGPIVAPMDLPFEQQDKQTLRAIFSTTRKSVFFGIQNTEQAAAIVEALIVATPKLDLTQQPVGFFVCSPTSPLVLDPHSADTLIFTLGKGLVPLLAPCPMAGGTSQFAIIGTVLQQVVENLFMLTAKFALAPEAPVLWGGAGAAMDMKVGDVAYGGIERNLIMLANIDMASYFGLPCHSPSASVDSCLIDVQLGAEKTWTYLTRVLSRAAMGIGVGAVTNGKAVSLEQMVIDTDLLGSVQRFASGIELDHLSAAANEITKIQHGGDFMMSDVTLDLLHEGKEYFYPATFNRGGTHAAPMLRRAHDEVERILADWENPVPEVIRADIDKLFGPPL